jgi:excisionase family DNA binding protein
VSDAPIDDLTGPPPEDFLTVSEAAAALGVTAKVLRSWESAGKLIPSLRTAGGHRRYSREDIRRARANYRLFLQSGDLVPNAEALAQDVSVIRAHLFSVMIEARRDKQYPAAIAAGKVLLDYCVDGDPLERGAPALPARRPDVEATIIDAETVPATDVDRLDALIRATEAQLPRATDPRKFAALANTLRALIRTRAQMTGQALAEDAEDAPAAADAAVEARLAALCAEPDGP